MLVVADNLGRAELKKKGVVRIKLQSVRGSESHFWFRHQLSELERRRNIQVVSWSRDELPAALLVTIQVTTDAQLSCLLMAADDSKSTISKILVDRDRDGITRGDR